MRMRGVGIVAMGVVLWTPGVAGQTQFAWPDTAVNWSRYTTIEECQAALQRSESDIQELDFKNGYWQDTMPDYATWTNYRDRKSANEMKRAPGPTTTKATQSCMDPRFANVDSVPLDRYALYVQLYLAAGWTPKLMPLLDRVAASNSTKFGAALDAVLDSIGQTPKARYTLLQEMVLNYAPRVTDPVQRAILYGKLLFESYDWMTGDSASQRQAAKRLEKFIKDSLTDAERTALLAKIKRGAIKVQVLGGIVTDLDGWISGINAIIDMKPDMYFDSLRKSTAAYLAYGYSQTIPIKKVTAEGKDTTIDLHWWNMSNPIGLPVVPIQAEVWAGRTDSTVPRPTKGHISLVVFLSPAWCPDGTKTWTCPTMMSTIHRLTKQYPKLEINIVARADGSYRWLATSPAQEAEVLHQLMAANEVKATVAMTSREHYMRSKPDGRRVNRSTPDPNWLYYREKIRERSIAGGSDPENLTPNDEPYDGTAGPAMLVDEGGTVVAYNESIAGADTYFKPYLDILFARKGVAP